jgi:hypothetical protein
MREVKLGLFCLVLMIAGQIIDLKVNGEWVSAAMKPEEPPKSRGDSHQDEPIVIKKRQQAYDHDIISGLKLVSNYGWQSVRTKKQCVKLCLADASCGAITMRHNVCFFYRTGLLRYGFFGNKWKSASDLKAE